MYLYFLLFFLFYILLFFLLFFVLALFNMLAFSFNLIINSFCSFNLYARCCSAWEDILRRCRKKEIYATRFFLLKCFLFETDGFRIFSDCENFALEILAVSSTYSRRACLPPRIHYANKDEWHEVTPFRHRGNFPNRRPCRRSRRARANVLSHATWITLKGHLAAFDARVHRGITREYSRYSEFRGASVSRRDTRGRVNPRLFLTKNFFFGEHTYIFLFRSIFFFFYKERKY